MPYNLSMMTRGGEIYKIQAKYKFDLQPKWEDEKFQTGGRYFLSFKQAQDFKKKLQGQSSYYMEYKVVKVYPKGTSSNPKSIYAKGGEVKKGSEWAFWAGLLGWGVLSYIGVNKK